MENKKLLTLIEELSENGKYGKLIKNQTPVDEYVFDRDSLKMDDPNVVESLQTMYSLNKKA